MPGRTMLRNRWIHAVLLLCISLAWGCGAARSDETPGQERVGLMSDLSYFKTRDKPPRISASGNQIAMAQFEGKFLWADYAAPWCSPCGPQSRIIAQLDDSMDESIVFLTVMTSETGGYGHPATRQTAQSWAGRHRLDPDLVVAATDLTSLTIPRHIFYSPEGQMLFMKTGTMRAAEIRDVISKRSADWKAWKETGKPARWMRR